MFAVYEIKTGKLVAQLGTRKAAVYWCKVNQTLPLPDYEFSDQFRIHKV